MFRPTPHPVVTVPTPEKAMAEGRAWWGRTMKEREDWIARERHDPFTVFWEPPIWRVCDALLGFPWVDPEWAAQMRALLRFTRPVDILLINGGQRGGKSQYAGNRVMRTLRAGGDRRAWALHTTLQMSRDYQQPIFYDYLPPELKVKDIKTRTTYLAYKQKTGFSEEKFVLPNRSDCTFKAYEQDVRAIEGGNLDIIWPDELVPPDWVKTMKFRIAEKGGKMIITFTPVEGYSETVGMFQDGAEVVRESVAFLLPRDGLPPLPHLALGLDEAEYAEVLAAATATDGDGRPCPRASWAPQSRPEDCDAWLRGETGQPAIPAGREFERVPRVMKVTDEEMNKAVVFFHSSDNPYGNPKNVWSMLA